MQNFFTESSHFTEATVTLTGDEHHHATRSCRVKTGEIICVTDGCGKRVEARIEAIDSTSLTAVIVRDLSGIGEPAADITVALAIINPARFEIAVEKCTELGVRRIVPVIARRCTVKPDRLKLDRLRRIAGEASKQSGRSWVPDILYPVGMAEFAAQAAFPVLAAWKDAENNIDKAFLRVKSRDEITLLFGPEGDFSDKEIELLKQRDAVFFSLGGLTLRSETAAVVSTALVVQRF